MKVREPGGGQSRIRFYILMGRSGALFSCEEKKWISES